MTDYKQPSVLRDVPSTASAHTDYHELPEVPRCCGTCRYITTIIMAEAGDGCIHPARMTIDPVPSYPRVAPHGLCSHWERRDD